MSLKDLFKEEKFKNLSNVSLNSLTSSGVESPEYIKAFIEQKNKFVPLVDYSKPENFARFGSAEKYYYDSITRIYNSYPYDGSKKEKLLWELSSSNLDIHTFNNGYPRTTGYGVFSTASITATDVSTDHTVWGSYGAAGTGTYEYVSFNGGPHAGVGSKIHIDPDTGEAHYRKGANLYDLSKNRECNLKIGGNDGNTVEFWLKKAAFDSDATQTEVLFDIFTTASISSSLDYGRMTIEMSGTATASPFFVTYMSGTNGISKQQIGESLTPASITDNNWHHYSFRFKNDGSNTSVDLFIDGEFNHNVKAGTTVDYVSGTIVGAIGALATNPSGTNAGAPQAGKGWGKLSGSLDEFRFWKVWRDSRQIQTRWFDQVGGGTNTDDANTHLGLYYKFNEGLTLTSSTDSIVLDYSGRVSNGTWTGYNSSYSRKTGSAINESNLSNFTGSEFRDPIIYAHHPEVVSFLNLKRKEGRNYDYNNPSTIYYSLPSWILEEHDANDPDNEGIIANSLWNLTQILSSYFDDVSNLAKSVPDLGQTSYFSGSQKPIPFMSRILESKGFIAPEIFNAIDALEQFENRDDNSLYTEQISNVKNIIYRNIYNNLSFINKSKGTEKSFRNLIRCFGIDDKVYKLNYYANNADYLLQDNFRTVSDKFKLVNFNLEGHSTATVYQYSSSLDPDPNSATFISASKDFATNVSQESGMSFTVETSIICPNRVDQSQFSTLQENSSQFQNNYSLMLTSSVYGMHTADDANPSDTVWASDDYANFIVRTIKPEFFSNKAKFVLTGTVGGFIPELTSSFFNSVYNDTPWNLMVSLYPTTYPNSNGIDGAGDSDYVVEFSGIQKVLDETINKFTVTGSITLDQATKFLASPKRVFVGAHRTNFSGTLLQPTDVDVNSIRVWQNKLSIDDLSTHASDLNNYSIKNPDQNAYLFNDKIKNVFVPNKETLLLHWNFDSVTGSDASGEFIVDDFTSGSIGQIPRYGFLSNILNKQFTGLGHGFRASSTRVVKIDDVVTAKPNIPEVLANENTIQVLTNDDRYFTRDSRPSFFDLYVEKSPYQNISEEMLKFMSTVVDFNNLIGHGVDRYRGEYKSLKLLRQLFFQRTDTPDIDKYIEYFKWFDLAVAAMIQKLAPMSSGLDERPLRNIIESHILERNKYESKFPTYEFKQSDPEAVLFGINELLYPWKEGHATESLDESVNCLWFKERAERSGEILTSGDADVDSDRQEILDVINNLNNATPPNLSDGTNSYQGSAYALRRFARPYKIKAVKEQQLHGGGNAAENKKVGFWDSIRKRPTQSTPGEGGLISIEPPQSNLEEFKGCDDNLELNKGKRKFKFSAAVFVDGTDNPYEVYKGQMVFPFSLYSSSVNSNPAYADLADFQENLAITNLHHDNYGPFGDVPLQGPFTEKYVGGRAYRHVMTNFTPDNDPPDTQELGRLEGWKISADSSALDLLNIDPHDPKSVYFREEYAKRPVNIKNIQQLTSAVETEDQATDAFGVTKIGNYTNTYEIVMTNGRSINNRYLAEADGFLPSITPDSTAVSGVIDFSLPRRDLTGSNKAIIVNRFSAPGDPATMGEGMLDTAAAEFSIYNVLPFRNLSVRQPLQEFLTNHTNQFGYFSDARTVADFERASWKDYPGGSSSINDPGADLNYIGTGSFHKVNRNGRKQPKYSNAFTGDLGTIEIDTAFDNFFVQHQIPQTDVQYAWITASIIENYTGSALYGFEKPDFKNASLASTDLTFVSSSNIAIAQFFNLAAAPTIFGIVYRDTNAPNFVNTKPFIGATNNLNYLFYEPVSSSTNTLGHPSGTPITDGTTTSLLKGGPLQYRNIRMGTNIGHPFEPPLELAQARGFHGLLYKRQGPAGGASWKLYKKDNHPVVRMHKAENRISYLRPVFGTNSDNKQILLSGSKGSITSSIEPPITSKYKPITHAVVDEVGGEPSVVTINHSYMNNINFFTDRSANEPKVNLDQFLLDPKRNVKTDQQTLDVINYYLYESNDFIGAENLNPIKGLVTFITKETIYPKEQYTYLSSHRQRQNYKNNYWRDSESDRRLTNKGVYAENDGPADATPTRGAVRDAYNFLTDAGTFYSSNVDRVYTKPEMSFNTEEEGSFTGSIWPLDGRLDYETNDPGKIRRYGGEFAEAKVMVGSTSGFMPVISGGSDGAGVLQNSFYPYANYCFGSSSIAGQTAGFNHIQYAPLFPQYNRRVAGVIDSDLLHQYKFGDTKWDAGAQSDKTPTYDTYSEFIEDIKRVGKDHTIIPEFRISNHMDFYLNEAPQGFLSKPDSFLELTGAAEFPNTEPFDSSVNNFFKTYSHSDFLKTFSVVSNIYGEETEASKVTLSVKALLKFLPYDGFYPADRVQDLARLFYESYKSSFAITGSSIDEIGVATEYNFGDTIRGDHLGMINPVWKAFFAPGILFNSIKSGIGVDYPVHTADVSMAFTGSNQATDGVPERYDSNKYLASIPRISSSFDLRIPFDGLLEPEKYINQYIIDNEPHPSASADLSASISTAGSLNYKLAMSNFLASTIDFFKPGGNLTTIISAPDGEPSNFGQDFDPNIEYRMRIALYNGQFGSLKTLNSQIEKGIAAGTLDRNSVSYEVNPPTCVMYAQTGSSNTKSSDYYGSAFGPPVANDSFLTTGEEGTYPLYGSASFEPFTPPYYDGYSHVELVFRPFEATIPDGESLNILNIMSNVQENGLRFKRFVTGYGEGENNSGWDDPDNTSVATRNRMNLTASIDFKVVQQASVDFDEFGNPLVIKKGPGDGSNILTIQPKWETPILNFKNVDVSVPSIGEGALARGMWHQYGVKPGEAEGIFMQVQDIDSSEFAPTGITPTGSLATLLGIDPKPRKLGQVAFKKKISEAIVAIPFYKTAYNTIQKYKLSKETVAKAMEFAKLKGAEENPNIGTPGNPDAGIVDMVRKMQKFVIPPHLDFIKSPDDIDPFAMFIIDFEVELKQQDLTDIWQNLTPDIGIDFIEKEVELPGEIFVSQGGGTAADHLMPFFKEDTRWMIFKVKQRSAYNYFEKTADSADDTNFKFQFNFGDGESAKTGSPSFSYNWPFDFFSLIELVKIDANVASIPYGLPPEPTAIEAIEAGPFKGEGKFLPDENLGVETSPENSPKEMNPEKKAGLSKTETAEAARKRALAAKEEAERKKREADESRARKEKEAAKKAEEAFEAEQEARRAFKEAERAKNKQEEIESAARASNEKKKAIAAAKEAELAKQKQKEKQTAAQNSIAAQAAAKKAEDEAAAARAARSRNRNTSGRSSGGRGGGGGGSYG